MQDLKFIVALSVLVALSGCANNEPPEKEQTVTPKLTWQEAKAATQATELEIAGRIPKDQVASIDQMKDGTLFSCDAGQYDWNGATTVTLKDGIDAESVVKALEASYAGSRFQVSADRDVLGDYLVELASSDTGEIYLFSEDDPNTIRIASASACFTLPEGTYPGGEW